MANIIRIAPYRYIHVLDTNSNVTHLKIGPDIYVKQDHERVVSGKDPLEMVRLAPRHYVIVKDPVIIGEDGSPQKDRYQQVVVRHGEKEVRFYEQYPEPFPLYPRESLEGGVTPLIVLKPYNALKLEADREFTDSSENRRMAGDQYYFEGPGTYYPRIEERVVAEVKARLIKTNESLKLRAKRELTDGKGKLRKAGEEWLVRDEGAYMPGVYEDVVGVVKATVLTDSKALHLLATKSFKDVYGKERKAGEEWIVTNAMAALHILDIYEEFVNEVQATILTKDQYCIVLDPVDAETGSNRNGFREKRDGEKVFFLLPGESLEGGIKSREVLSEEEALLLKAVEQIEIDGELRKPGDRWMVRGPCSYIPPVEVEIVERRRSIPLHLNEGVYVRDTKSGAVRAVIGTAYMLNAQEELFQLSLSDTIEELLAGAGQGRTDRTRVVTYRVPDNSVCQIYDFKAKRSRCVMGPDLVMLGPDEQFTPVILSGGKPKVPGVIKCLHALLGPDFSTDILEVETADHARLKLQLSYNWHFDIDRNDENSFKQVFNVRDFVGNVCNSLAALVRGKIAGITFEDFHRESARFIRKSIFGVDEHDKIKDRFFFPENCLVVTNVDIQGAEPVDPKTRISLQNSVTQAIEISSKAVEQNARHNAERLEQEAEGQLKRQEIEDATRVEEERIKLAQLKSECDQVRREGSAIAEAKAEAEANKIILTAAVEAAEKHAKATRMLRQADLDHDMTKMQQEIAYQSSINELEISRARALAEIESDKFKKTIGAIGAETLVALSEAGPKMQAEMLESLGLQGYMLMDTDNPVNLFSTAQGLLGGGMMGDQQP
jgi:major vault protein